MLSILRSVQGPTQVTPHCVACQLYEEYGDREAVLYIEQWDSKLEFQEHVRSEPYRRILAAIELSKTPPELCFHQVSATEGLELVHRLRGTAQSAPQTS